MSFLTPSRTVLMISDDALFIYSSGARGVKLVEAVPWNAESFEDQVATIISKECGGKPVMILNDMVEQHYRKERLPKVSVMDKQNVLQRKIAVAFPNYPVRAALPIKEKKKKSKDKRSGALYLFTAIPSSEPFTKTIGAARRSLVTISGFGLLPIESSDLVKRLSDKLSAKGALKSSWTVFIGQHRGGGLRQVVVKDGDLALTRMTPVVDGEGDPVKWAEEVLQEFKATMSYLTRFGYDSADGLNVILVAGTQAADAFEAGLDIPCNLHTMTAPQAAAVLGVRIGVQESDYYADVLHVAWAARKSKLRLPMKAQAIDNVSRPRQIAMAATVLLVLGAAGQGYQLLDVMQGVTSNWSDMDTYSNQYSQMNLQYQKEVKRKQDLGFDIQLIQSSLAVNDKFEKRKIDFLDVFYNIALGLGRDMRIDRIELQRGESAVSKLSPSSVHSGKIPLFVADMQMTFPSTMDARKGNAEVERLQVALQTLMKDYTVKITKLLEDYEYSEEIVVEAGEAGKKAKEQDYVAEITIEGPLQ